jgi:hypothetical protein
MTFRVILKQEPEVGIPNHFKYRCIKALNNHADELLSINVTNRIENTMHSLRTNSPNETFFVFNLENVDEYIDESVIGRVMTTPQLVDILESDEYREDTAECSLLLGGITTTHHIYCDYGVIHDVGLEDIEVKWSYVGFIDHYKDAVWRILD